MVSRKFWQKLNHPMNLRLLSIGLVWGGIAFAQSGNPNCQYQYELTNRTTEPTDGKSVILVSGGTARTPSINNSAQLCNAWILSVSVEGFSAISLELDDSQNSYTTKGGTPTSWAAWQGTVTGTNPSTTITSFSNSYTGFYPWISVFLGSSTGTGSINVSLYGWKSPAYLASTSGGGSPTGFSIIPSAFYQNNAWGGSFQPAGNLWAFAGACGAGSAVQDVAGSPASATWTTAACYLLWPNGSGNAAVTDFLSGSTPKASQISFRGARSAGTGNVYFGWSPSASSVATFIGVRYNGTTNIQGVVRSAGSDLGTCVLNGTIDTSYHTYSVITSTTPNTVTVKQDLLSCVVSGITIPTSSGGLYALAGTDTGSTSFLMSESWIYIQGLSR